MVISDGKHKSKNYVTAYKATKTNVFDAVRHFNVHFFAISLKTFNDRWNGRSIRRMLVHMHIFIYQKLGIFGRR